MLKKSVEKVSGKYVPFHHSYFSDVQIEIKVFMSCMNVLF